MNPKLSQCAPLTLTVSVTANLNNFRSWKNSQNGVFMESIGDVRLNNFLVADNLAVNLEVAKTPHTPDGTAQIVNALIIGYSGNADATTLASSAVGLTTPRSENFQVNGAKFFNLDLNNMVPIQPCSQCNLGRDFTDSGARTVTFSQLYFQGFNRVLRYVFPRRDILLDLDGTLTGLGPNTWATPIWEHNKQPQCQESPINDSLFCDSTVEVRRIALYNYVPGSLTNAEIEILRWDEYADLPNIDYNYYENDTTKYSIIPWKTFGDPRFGWALPFVTNHAYKLHWRQGIDFTRISLDISERWQPDDSNLRLIFNHTAKREQWQVEISNVSPKELIPRDTLQTLTNTEWQSGDNAQYNASEIRQLHLLINGKNKTRKTLTIRGYECLDYCPVVPRGGGYGGDDVPCPGIRYWNVPNHWDSGYVPIQNEDVVIRRNCVFYFNVQSTPVLNSVTVYGTLIWLNDAPDLSLTMNTRVLFNRGGVIKIGEEGAPFMGKLAQVRLWGTKFTPQEAFAPQIDGGNKMIGNTGQLQMFGMPRERFARLKQVATKGTLNIRVEPGLDWQANDQIAILTTNNNWKGSEDVFIESYNDLTGEIVLKSQLLHTHWGTENPTNQQYDVDLRAEVLLLTSNVKVTSQDEGTNWGCQIVTSDTLDSLGNRVGGQLKADNIEAYNCSQFDSFRAALRFDFAMKNESYVRNSAFHHGLGYGLQISYSQNINIEDCIFYDFIQFGGNIQSSHKLILSGNFFAHIGYYENNFNYVKPNAALLICIYLDNDVCSSLMIHDNTVAGSFYAGYGAPAIDCDATIGGLTFISNIAHSVNGEGAIFMPDKNSATQLTCLEVILFKAYKNMRYGAIVVAPTKEIRFKNMVLIDNGYGTGIMMGREGNDLKVKMSNIKYYGETEHKDCEVRDQCLSSPGSCTNKVAMVLPIMLNDYNPPFPRNESLPDLLEYDASWGGKIELEDIIFSNYPSNKQFCGGQISLFEPHRDASDYTPEVIFKNAIFRGVSKDALGFFHSPNPSWNTVEECGEFGCTGLQNVIVTFKELTTLDQYDTTFGINSNAPLSLVSNNPNLNAFYEDLGCTRLPNLNGYICYTDSIGHLMFESLDSDSFQRTVSPITIVSPDLPKYKNVLNSFRDKKSSILLGQQRNSRFPLTVVAPEGTHYMYSLTYTGTVPEKQRFALRDTPSGVVVQIKYAEQNSYSVRNEDNGQLIEYNDYDKSIGKQKPITEFKVCGENRYIGVVNILEFYITPGCSLLIEPRNVVMAQVRLEWTIAEFYKDGGTTMFIDRLSAVLGIHPSYVKIVTVYEGSVIIDFRITADEDDDYAVSAIKYKLDDTLGKNTTIFGAPLLDYKVTATVKIEYPDETFQVYNSTVEVKEDSGMIGGLTTTQSLLLVVLGGVTLACVIFLLIFYTVCKKSKTVSIKVNEKDEKVPEEKKADLNLSQEYEHQYHPKTTIGKSFFNLREGEQEKPNQDSVADNEMGQGSSPASSPRVWGRETWDQGCDTVRTANGNRYNEDNILITARSQRQWPDNMETELNFSKKTSSQFTEYDSPTSLANPEK